MTNIKNWVLATRPWSFPASMMPAIVAITYIIYIFSINDNVDNISITNAIIAIIGVLFFHSAGNLISDYFDYKYGIDREGSFGSSHMLVEEVFAPKSILKFGIILLIIGSLIGFYLLYITGLPTLYIGILGILGTIYYYKFKHVAMGDFLIFVLYGLLIALGMSYVMTGSVYWKIMLISSPVGLLVVNILHANNTRDIIYDQEANIKTFAMKVGLNTSKKLYTIIYIISYCSVLALVGFKIIHPLSLTVFISLPIAIKNVKLMKQGTMEDLGKIKNIDSESAKLVLAFGLLLIISNIIGLFL